jgi:hypothetical protein
MAEPSPDDVLRDIGSRLTVLGQSFALVGGLAVSILAEVRFTRDVDLAIAARDDTEVEHLVFELQGSGYIPVALVEHTDRRRLSTVRLSSPSGIVVDLLAASCGIEAEVIQRATEVEFGRAGKLLVARPEELLPMKVLSVSNRRPQDHIDAINLILFNDSLDLKVVRANLSLITERGFHRNQDLLAKLEAVQAAAAVQARDEEAES